MTRDTTSSEFFEEKYRENPDPWSFAGSAYEAQRYDKTIRRLEGKRYSRAFEPGCSIGVLTARLAGLCNDIAAMDISQSAVMEARGRCKAFPNVRVFRGVLPGDMPEGTFDLIVFSEIGYYFSDSSLRELAKRLEQRLEKAGTLIAAHWLGTSEDHLLSGDRVHEVLATTLKLRREESERHEGFRLDVWIA